MIQFFMALILCVAVLPAQAVEPQKLSLEEAQSLLEQHNPTLKRAIAQKDQAVALSQQARAAWLPTLSVSGTYLRNNEQVELALGDLMQMLAATSGQGVPADLPDNVVLQPEQSYSGAATLRLPLIVPSAYVSSSAAVERREASESNLLAARAVLQESLLRTSWLETSARGYVLAAEATLETAKQHSVSAERALKGGTGTSLAVLQAQTEIVRREGELVQARAGLEKAQLALGTLLGQSHPVQVEMPLPELRADVTLEAWQAMAQSQRSELQAAQRQVDALRKQVLAERLSLAPTLMGHASAFASDVAYPTGEQTGWQATVNLSWTLYQGGLRNGKMSQAQASLQEAEAGLEALRLAIWQQVENAYDDVEVALTRQTLATKQRALAEEAAAVASRAFDAGTLGSPEVLDTLERLSLARVNEQDSLARLGMALVALKGAAGDW